MTAPHFTFNASPNLLDLDDPLSFDSSELLSSTLNDDAVRQLNFDEDSGISSDMSNCSLEASSELSVSIKGPMDFSSMLPRSPASPSLPPNFSESLDPAESSANTSLNGTLNSVDFDTPGSSSSGDHVSIEVSVAPSPEFKAPLMFARSGQRAPFRDVTNMTPSKNNTFEAPLVRRFSSIELERRSLSIAPSHSAVASPRRVKTPKRHRSNNGSSGPSSSKEPRLHRTSSTVEIGAHHTQLGDDSPDVYSRYRLPGINRHKTDIAFLRIDSETLANLLLLVDNFDKDYILIDCRYPYEYNGGHIANAINLYDPDDLFRLFYPMNPTESAAISTKTPIFYCEYSSIRGPNMANALRKFDRLRNQHRWPELDFKEIYVLSEGYKHFYNTFSSQCNTRNLCVPLAYTPMTDPKYFHELQKFQHHKKTAFRTPSAARNLFKRTRSMIEDPGRS